MKSIISTILLLTLCFNSAFARNSTDLIQTPTARFNQPGEFWTEAYNIDSITGLNAGYQWGDSAQINLYKQKNTDIPREDNYHQSIDLKFRLSEENKYTPAIALGINSIAGDSELEFEYLSFSRKFYNFDFHTGIAWGGDDSNGNIDNPLSFLGSHFKETSSRNLRSRAETMFTGDKASLFGGLSYQATENLKLNLEYNDMAYADLYHNKKAKSPISFGADYNIGNYTVSAALENSNKLMTRLKYSYDTKKLKPNYKEKMNKIKKIDNQNINLSTAEIIHKATSKDINAHGITMNLNSADMWLEFKEQDNAKQNLLDASRVLYQNTNDSITKFSVTQTKKGRSGAKASILRRDLEKLDSDNGSMDKLIHKMVFESAYGDRPEDSYKNHLSKYGFISPGINIDPAQKHKTSAYRAYIIAGAKTSNYAFNNWGYGIAGRLNLDDNLEKEWIISQGRGTEEAFANNRVYLENMYARRIYRPFKNLYIDAQSGYLEEMFIGASIETLYKPTLSNWAVGFNINEVFQRKPYTMIGFYPAGDSSGEISFYYEPDTLENTILKISFVEYLANDRGVSLSAEKKFNNGIKLKAFSNFSDSSDEDYTNYEAIRVNAGINLSFPIGYGSKYNYIKTNIAPIGLIAGETLRKPENLYNDLRDISYNNLVKFKK